jgi:crossover junction endodeoxyribonuclease RusA
MNLILPYPVSANRYWRIAGKILHRSPEAKAFRQTCALRALEARVRPLDGPVAVRVALHPRKTKSGAASLSRLDLDNCLKTTLDALQGIAYRDDKQVVAIHATVACPIHGGGVSITVDAAP